MLYVRSLIYLLGAYFVGAFPSGWLVARLKGVKNIRQLGSGNIGATNVARVLGIRYFFLVFFLDAFKAFGYLWIVYQISPRCECTFIYALALILGNTRSVFLGFDGGKGIATSFGILAALYPAILVLVLFVWVVAYFVTRTIGMASVFALLALPLFAVALRADVVMIMFFYYCIFNFRKIDFIFFTDIFFTSYEIYFSFNYLFL